MQAYDYIAGPDIFLERTGASNPLDGIDVGYSAKPWCGDLDNDGDKDCLIGESDGTVKYFLNTGSASSPAYTEQTGASNPLNGIDVGRDAAPWCGDLDGDGDKDW